MVDPAVARRYAEAFVNLLQGSHQVEVGLEDLKALARTYNNSHALQRFLGSPEIGEEDKERLLSRVWSESIGAEGMSLLDLLLKWDRMDHLPAISEEAQSVVEARQGVLRGKAITAHAISSAETERLAKAVGNLLGKKVVLERHVDPQLIGGIRIVVGTAILDGSVRMRLGEIRRQLMEVKVN